MPTSPLNQYLIGLGSNLGERGSLLSQARERIARDVGPVVAAARTYSTLPVGAADRTFLNSALLVSTALAPRDLMLRLLAVEGALGRVRTVKWGNRTIDLDVLLWSPDGTPATFEDDLVRIPHPHLLERDFALVPAAEIAGSWIHPVSGLTLAEEVIRRRYSLSE